MIFSKEYAIFVFFFLIKFVKFRKMLSNKKSKMVPCDSIDCTTMTQVINE